MKNNLYLIPILLLVVLASCGDKDKPQPNIPDPVALFDAPTEIEKGVAHTFVNKSTDAQSFTWTVTPAAGVSIVNAEAKDAVITFNQAGDHEVKLEAKRAGKPSSIVKKTVKVTADPVADFTFTFGDINIVPAKVKLKPEGSTNGSSFEWTITGGFSVGGNTADPDSILFNQAGDYVVKLVAIKDGKRSVPKEKTISILAGPDFTMVKDPNFSPTKVTITNTSAAANFDSFQWSFDDPSAEFKSSHTYLFYEPAGTFTVFLIAKKNGITRTSVQRQVNLKDDFLSIFYSFPSGGTDLVKDFSGNDKHAFIPVGSNPAFVIDKFGVQHAIWLDGTDDRFIMPQGSLKDIFETELKASISLRVKFGDALNWSRVLIGSYADVVGGSYTPILYYSSIDSTIRGQFPGGISPLVSSKITSKENWYHIVLTAELSSGKQKLYINGELEKEIVLPINFGDERNTEIGRGNIFGWPGSRTNTNPPESVLFFRGSMDDIRFYKKVLSLAEVKALNNE